MADVERVADGIAHDPLPRAGPFFWAKASAESRGGTASTSPLLWPPLLHEGLCALFNFCSRGLSVRGVASYKDEAA